VSRRTKSGAGDARVHDALETERGRLEAFLRVDRDLDLGAEDAQLLDGGGALDVGGDHQRPLAVLVAEELGELRAGRGLARALETGEEDDRRTVLGELEARVLRPEEIDELPVEGVDELRGGVDARDALLADDARADARREVLDDLEVDVGLEERGADLPQTLLDVRVGELALAAQEAEGGREALSQGLEHGESGVYWIRPREKDGDSRMAPHETSPRPPRRSRPRCDRPRAVALVRGRLRDGREHGAYCATPSPTASPLAAAAGQGEIWVAEGTSPTRRRAIARRASVRARRPGLRADSPAPNRRSPTARALRRTGCPATRGRRRHDFANRSDNTSHVVVTTGFLDTPFDGSRGGAGTRKDSPGGGAWVLPGVPFRLRGRPLHVRDNEPASPEARSTPDKTRSTRSGLRLRRQPRLGGGRRVPLAAGQGGSPPPRCRFSGIMRRTRRRRNSPQRDSCLRLPLRRNGADGRRGAAERSSARDSRLLHRLRQPRVRRPLVAASTGPVPPGVDPVGQPRRPRGGARGSASELAGAEVHGRLLPAGWTPDLDGAR
jgi:hypothetical protein